MLFDVICENILKKLHEWDPIVNFGDSDSSNCCVNWCLSSSSWGDHEGRSGISFSGILEILGSVQEASSLPNDLPSVGILPKSSKVSSQTQESHYLEIDLGSVVLKSFKFSWNPWDHNPLIFTMLSDPTIFLKTSPQRWNFSCLKGRWKNQEGSGSKGFGSTDVFLSLDVIADRKPKTWIFCSWFFRVAPR